VTALPDSTPLCEVDLSMRTYTACLAAGLQSVGDLRRQGPDGMRRLPNIGLKAVREIVGLIGTWASVSAADYAAAQSLAAPQSLAAIPTPVLVAELARRFPVGG
jgi:hypothetical protein